MSDPRSQKSKGIRTGAEDIAFLADCGRYGTLSTADAESYFPGLKHNSLLRRLRLLSQNGLTTRTQLEVWKSDSESRGGRIPLLNSLTEAGADLVEQSLGVRPPRVLRSRPAGTTFLHRCEIVRVMRAFDLGCDAVGLSRPEWVMEQDAWPEAPKHLPPNQKRLLYHDFGNGVCCLPDIACHFQIGSTTMALFWDIDLSTEGRKQLRKASKTDAYGELLKRQAYRRYWPKIPSPRCYILWVTHSSRRFEGLRETIGKHPIAAHCRMLAADSLNDAAQLLTLQHWETMEGDRRPMYRPMPRQDEHSV